MFNEYQGNSGDDRLSVIIHMLGRNVLENKGYQAWMNKFPSRVEVSLYFRSNTLQCYPIFTHIALTAYCRR